MYGAEDCRFKSGDTELGQPVTGKLFLSMQHSESESELFTGDTSKDNHSPGPVFREVSP